MKKIHNELNKKIECEECKNGWALDEPIRSNEDCWECGGYGRYTPNKALNITEDDVCHKCNQYPYSDIDKHCPVCFDEIERDTE